MAVHKITNEDWSYRTDSDRCAECQRVNRLCCTCAHHSPVAEQVTPQPATAPHPAPAPQRAAPERPAPAPAARPLTPEEQRIVDNSAVDFRTAVLLGAVRPDDKPARTIADIAARM